MNKLTSLHIIMMNKWSLLRRRFNLGCAAYLIKWILVWANIPWAVFTRGDGILAQKHLTPLWIQPLLPILYINITHTIMGGIFIMMLRIISPYQMLFRKVVLKPFSHHCFFKDWRDLSRDPPPSRYIGHLGLTSCLSMLVNQCFLKVNADMFKQECYRRREISQMIRRVRRTWDRYASDPMESCGSVEFNEVSSMG